MVKVKEPLPPEYRYLRPGLVLFTYLHLAADESLIRTLLESGITGIAYETVELSNGTLPLLTPMSEVAGRMAVQVGAHYLLPGAVPRTSTYGLSNATLPYVMELANKGFRGAIQSDRSLALGVNIHQGRITYQAVAEAFDMPYTPLSACGL